jgi:hypothetical protein
LNSETCFSSLSEFLGLEKADEDELYEAMDWLLSKQELIENELAKTHLTEGALVLYDVSSTYFEGTQCPLARSGYNRDKKKGFLQIVFGLLCDKRGCPIAVEVFEGNSSDTTTITSQRVRVSPQVPRSNLGRDSGSTEERSRTITFAVLPET